MFTFPFLHAADAIRRELEVDANADLQPARSISLNEPVSTRTQNAPMRSVGHVEARIGRLHVVQHVREVKVHRATEALGHPDFLGDAQVKVPQWHPAEYAATPDLSIQPQNRVAGRISEDAAVDRATRVWVGEHVYAGSGGAAVGPLGVEMGAAARRKPRGREHHILVGTYVGRVGLAEARGTGRCEGLVRETALP